jgi:hypothetical protein
MSRGSQMSPCDRGDSASLYALGLLDDAEIRAFENHLKSCESCEAEVRESGELGSPACRHDSPFHPSRRPASTRACRSRAAARLSGISAGRQDELAADGVQWSVHSAAL